MNDVPIRPNRQEGELVTYLEFQDLGDKDTLVINVKGGAVVSCDKNYVYVKILPRAVVSIGLFVDLKSLAVNSD